MPVRFVLSAVVLALAACATTGSAPAAKPAGEEGHPDAVHVDKLRIANLSTFDVAVCWPPVAALPVAGDGAVITGALLSARPRLLECLVDPLARGAAAESDQVVEVTVGDVGPSVRVQGDNLTAKGKACLEQVAQELPWKPLKPGSKPVTGRVTLHHGKNSPAVRLGINEASDVAGQVRLSMRDWCDCFQLIASEPPPTVQVRLALKTGQGPVAVVEQGDGPVAQCLLPKLRAGKYASRSAELSVPLPLLLLNSQGAAEASDAQPELQFAQLDAIRSRGAARVALAVGTRNQAVLEYDALVAKYKAKAGSVAVKLLRDACAAMVAADDALVDADQKQADLESRTLALAQRLAQKDASWTQAAQAAQAQVDAATAELEKAKRTRAADAAVCPKERY